MSPTTEGPHSANTRCSTMATETDRLSESANPLRGKYLFNRLFRRKYTGCVETYRVWLEAC